MAHALPLALPAFLSLLLTAPSCVPECVGIGCDDPSPDDDVADDDTGTDDDTPDDDSPGDDDDGTPLPDVRSCDTVVRVRPGGSPGSLDIAGEWNGWSPEPMTGPDAGGAWSVAVPTLPPGEYAYKLLPDGQWEGDPPDDVYAKWLDGIENRALRVGDCERPLLHLLKAQASPDGSLFVSVQFVRAAGGSNLDESSIQLTVGGEVHAATVAGGVISITLTGLAPGKHSVLLSARDADGEVAENAPLWLPLWVEPERFDFRDGLLYFAFVDRFRDGDFDQPQAPPVPDVPAAANFQGGDYLGVLDALREGYFEALGVRTLWLSPPLENPDTPWLAADGVHNFSGFHGYWPVDPFDIEDHYGDATASPEDRLRELITEAHARGIRVLFDLVLNHVHEEHLYVDEHPEWFGGGCVCGSPGCGWDEHARDCWFMPYLPDLDYRNHAILERVTDDTLALLRAYDVDAVRVDAAKHMDHVIMRTLRMRLRDEVECGGCAPFELVGETFTGADGHGLINEFVGPTELTGQFDFPLMWPIRDAFAHGGSLAALDAAVQTGEAAWDGALMSPFLGNHDVVRFVTEAEGNGGGAWGSTPDAMASGGSNLDRPDLVDRVGTALAFVMTLPGQPLLYYGDEIGLAGDADPDNRRRMNFAPYLSANQEAALSQVQAVGQARAGDRALRRGAYQSLWSDTGLLVFARTTADDVAIVALTNGGGRSQSVPVQGLLDDGSVLVDATDPSRTVTVQGGAVQVDLGTWDHAILVTEDAE